VFDQVPDTALGVAVVRNLAATDAKVQQVAQIFAGVVGDAPPAPLALAKATLRIGDGLNEQGDVVLAFLPGNEPTAAPKPLLLIPVSDYAKFAASVGGDDTGELTRVVLAGQEVHVARQGGFALLMNVADRELMEKLLATPTTPAPLLGDELSSWLAANDVAVVLLPAGLELLTGLGQQGVAQSREELEGQLADPAVAKELAQAKIAFDMYDNVLGFLGAKVRAAAVGVSIDDASNIKLSDRIVFERGDDAASTTAVAPLEGSILAGYPDQPFVFAGGGPLPPSWVDAYAKFLRNMIEQMPEVYGFEEFDAAKWQRVEDSWRAAMKVRSYTFVMYAGERGDPLFSNIFGLMEVDDSQVYLQAMRDSMTIWNELTAESSGDIKMKYEIEEVELAGAKGTRIVTDVLAAAGDDDVPGVKMMFDAMFGEGGKFEMYVVVADDDTVIFTMSDEADATRAVEWVKNNEHGLAQSPHVQAATQLLEAPAPWKAYISPQGYISWINRMYAAMAGPLGAPPMTIPEYPAGPPLGFALNSADDQLRGEMVVPVQALKDLAGYIEQQQ
jgi:hypothetical protein